MYLGHRWIPAFAGMTINLLLSGGLLLTVILGTLPARADELADVVAGLGSPSFTAKEKAIAGLGKLGDPRAVPILKGLADDRLRKAPEGRVVLVETIGGTTKVTDPALKYCVVQKLICHHILGAVSVKKEEDVEDNEEEEVEDAEETDEE